MHYQTAFHIEAQMDIRGDATFQDLVEDIFSKWAEITEFLHAISAEDLGGSISFDRFGH